MDIKLKSKITKPVKILGACVIGIILCLGIYYFVDYILNGSFVDWFEEHYMITQEQYIPEIGSNGIVRQPVYSEIKKLLLLVFISVVILGIGITFAVSHFHAKSQTRKAITKIILGACVIGIILCLGIYYFVDYILNGSFVDWFEEHYMITQEQYIPEIGSNGIVRQPVYSEIKKLLLLVFISVVILGIGITFAVSHFHAKSQTRKAITKISEKMHDFMQSEKEAVEVFPKEYAEISTQMVEIKFTMQRHEQILKEEAARKNDLIAYLAHDLKTPLTSVIGYLSLLDEAVDMPTPQRAKYVSITLDKAKRLEKLINEFFEITRYNLQGIVLEKETIDLYYMLVQMTDEFYPLLQAHQNTTELDVDEEMTIYGDAENLARVFNNILKNAVAYSYPGTVIKISAKQTDTEVQICFQNKGKTIPAHKLESIFEKFFRLDESRSSNTGGAGLGLAIAKEIVTLHGGTISADSHDEITTFSITLPVSS